MKNNILERAGKTFVEGFLCVMIPQIVLILNNVTEYDFSNWQAWLIPIVCGALASGISAAWNGIQNMITDKEDK